MKHYAPSDFEWRNNNLYHGKKKTGFGVEAISVIDQELMEQSVLFLVKYPDGIFSKDYYNLTRAKDHAVRLAAKTYGGMGHRGTVDGN